MHFECARIGFLTRQYIMNLRETFYFIVGLFDAPKRAFGLLAVVPIMLLSFGLYLQHVVGLEPCPMCIVQRYVMLIMMMWALAMAFLGSQGHWTARMGFFFYAVFGVCGAYVAARQSWLQWYPPEVVSCGRDFYGMIETFPLKRAIPMIFKGGGDCSAVDWTFLGGSIANWSFVAFTVLALLSLALLLKQRSRG